MIDRTIWILYYLSVCINPINHDKINPIDISALFILIMIRLNYWSHYIDIVLFIIPIDRSTIELSIELDMIECLIEHFSLMVLHHVFPTDVYRFHCNYKGVILVLSHKVQVQSCKFRNVEDFSYHWIKLHHSQVLNNQITQSE